MRARHASKVKSGYSPKWSIASGMKVCAAVAARTFVYWLMTRAKESAGISETRTRPSNPLRDRPGT